MTVSGIREQIQDMLADAGIEEADYETRILLEAFAGIDRETYLLEPGKELESEKADKALEMASRRAERIPLWYLIGEAPFMGYSFLVDENVLIPRQDTECLADLAVQMISDEYRQRKQMQKTDRTIRTPLRVLDLCAGSGCIGISVKLLSPETEVVLADISREALRLAERNAERLHADVSLCGGNLFENVRGRYDYILSNPPYIPSEDIKTLMPEVRDHEPLTALDGEADGLTFYRRICREAPRYLYPSGKILFEIGASQGKAVRDILAASGFEEIVIRQDLNGLDRVVSAGKA